MPLRRCPDVRSLDARERVRPSRPEEARAPRHRGRPSLHLHGVPGPRREGVLGVLAGISQAVATMRVLCACGQCYACKRREYNREWYRRQTPEKKQAMRASKPSATERGYWRRQLPCECGGTRSARRERCRDCARKLLTTPASDRFWSKVRRGTPDVCWLWTSTRNGRYGVFFVRKEQGRQVRVYAHRMAYQLATGNEPPAGMQIDHLCSTSLCVNPAHLDLVAPGENLARYYQRIAIDGRTRGPERRLRL